MGTSAVTEELASTEELSAEDLGQLYELTASESAPEEDEDDEDDDDYEEDDDEGEGVHPDDMPHP